MNDRDGMDTMIALQEGYKMGLLTVTITLFLECLSTSCVASIRSQACGNKLYIQGWALNVVNNLFVGPIFYAISINYCRHEGMAALPFLWSSGGVLLMQAIGYYLVHKAFHDPRLHLYWAHRFHHRFSKNVAPSTAHAVTPVEYICAYMIPIMVGVVLFQPDPVGMALAVSIIAGNNLLIHTPWLESAAQAVVPWYAVSTHDHLQHHRKLSLNFAAPTLNIDRLLEKAPPLFP